MKNFTKKSFTIFFSISVILSFVNSQAFSLEKILQAHTRPVKIKAVDLRHYDEHAIYEGAELNVNSFIIPTSSNGKSPLKICPVAIGVTATAN
jgi:hypothetical protein